MKYLIYTAATVFFGGIGVALGTTLFSGLVVYNSITVNHYRPGECYYVEHFPHAEAVEILATGGNYITQMVVSTPFGADTVARRVHFNEFGGTRFHTFKPDKFEMITKMQFDSIVSAHIRWVPYGTSPIKHDRRREKK